MAHSQKPEFVFWRNGWVHLNRRRRQFIRLLAAEVCASAVVMLDTPCSQVVWRVLATHSIRQFPLHFPSRPSPCAITFQLDSNTNVARKKMFSVATMVTEQWQRVSSGDWPCAVTVSRHKRSLSCRVQLKYDGTRWRTGEQVRGKLANGVGSQCPSHYLGTWCIQHYYRWCAHLGCQ